MKNNLMLFYGLSPEDIVQKKKDYWFYINYQMYILANTNMEEAEAEQIYSYLIKNESKYFEMLKSCDKRLICTMDKEKYILVKVNKSPNNEIDIKNILKNTILIEKPPVSLNRSNWSELWSAKADYLEYQVSQMAIDHSIVRNSFSYFLGLAENAIEYYNAIKKTNTPLVLVQKKICYPNIAVNYFNPITLVVDYKVREVAEYLKSCFFNSASKDEINEFFSSKQIFTDEEYNLLFARLLYPSYYFDEVTEVLEHNKDDSSLLKYIDKTSEYELFLKKCLEEFSKHSNMIRIDWLIINPH